MPLQAGIELDCRVGARVVWPVPVADFTYDQGAIFTTAWPTVPFSPPGYWQPVLPYKLYEQLPPGYRVLCGITIPAFSTDLALARQAAGIVAVEYDQDEDAATICNRVIEA